MDRASLRRAAPFCVLLALAISFGAAARNLDGTLGPITKPISTVPIIVKAGATFEVTIAAERPLEEMQIGLYRGTDATAVFTHARQEPPLEPKDGLITIKAGVPPDLKPGLYSLSLRANPGRMRDTAERAVKVVTEWPKSYSFAHVTDVHIGRQDPPLRDEVFKRTASEINRLGVDFVLITGDVTDDGTAEQFRRFLMLLDGFEAPTLVAPGNHDRGEGGQFGAGSNVYERFCGPGNYAFDFGTHRYLCLDTRWEAEFLVFPAHRAWLEAQLQRADPSLGVVFSHRISDEEYPYYQQRLPSHNYRLYVYGHTHDDGIQWIGPKRLMLLNTSQELLSTYNVVRISDDQVVAIDHHHRASSD